MQYGPPAYGRRSILHPNFEASGERDGIAPNLSGLRRYSPIRPRQTHGILSILIPLEYMNSALLNAISFYSQIPKQNLSFESRVIVASIGLVSLKKDHVHEMFLHFRCQRINICTRKSSYQSHLDNREMQAHRGAV